ncbi:MAG: discoidin domain-containing protein [Zoogloeaceae bacterium]|jgi:hypothetical protein|nr:discoidin domain-containing protein [Zoogloeaceae bacterium]
MTRIRFKRGTLAQLDAAAAAGELAAGEPYYVTDMGAVTIGTSATAYRIVGGGALPTLRREFWTAQIVVADGFEWGRLGGSVDGHEDEYATVIGLYPGIVVAGNPSDLIYAPMTVADAPAPQVATASSTTGQTNYGGWRAFDGDAATEWRSAGGNYTSDAGGAVGDQWVQIDLGQVAACGAMGFSLAEQAHAPKDFVLYASLTNPANDTDWYAAATPLVQASGVTTPQVFEISNGSAHRYFRLRVTRIQAASSTGVYVAGVNLYARELALKNTEDAIGSCLYVRLDGGG